MEAVATQKFVKISPRKLRLVADMVRKMRPQEALEVLPFLEKRGSGSLEKLLKTGIANARQAGMDEENLLIGSLEVQEGPRLKRFRAVSRGRAHGYVKRMSHLKLVLREGKSKTKVKETKTEEKNPTKPEATLGVKEEKKGKTKK